MGYARKIRFEYYEVVCKKHDDEPSMDDRLFDLSLFIDAADKLELDERKYKFRQEHARVDSLSYDDNQDLWFMGFVRLRETDIPSIAKDDQEAEPIVLAQDEYIGETACALYDENLHVIMLQRNVHSLGPTGIEFYLNKVWNSKNEQIYLRPICPLEIQRKINGAAEYRKITIRLAHLNKVDSSNEKQGKKPFKKLVESTREYGADYATLEVSVGYDKNGILNRETVKSTVSDIWNNKDIVSGAKINLKDTPDSEVETLDLFEEKLHDYMTLSLENKESVMSERMRVLMTEQYKESKGKIIAAIRK